MASVAVLLLFGRKLAMPRGNMGNLRGADRETDYTKLDRARRRFTDVAGSKHAQS
jgi:hypothetical protein